MSPPTTYPDPGDGLGPYVEVPVYVGGRASLTARISPHRADDVLALRWRLTNRRYAATQLAGTTVRLHRYVMGEPPAPGLEVDHRNRQTLDCRDGNLRWATRTQQNQNSPGRTRAGSPYRGVRRSTGTEGRWYALIRNVGRATYLGSYGTAEEAARAYDRAARALHGEFALLNFPDET
jgi:hypothetical protein